MRSNYNRISESVIPKVGRALSEHSTTTTAATASVDSTSSLEQTPAIIRRKRATKIHTPQHQHPVFNTMYGRYDTGFHQSRSSIATNLPKPTHATDTVTSHSAWRTCTHTHTHTHTHAHTNSHTHTHTRYTSHSARTHGYTHLHTDAHTHHTHTHTQIHIVTHTHTHTHAHTHPRTVTHTHTLNTH
jgi:hypothetical protein